MKYLNIVLISLVITGVMVGCGGDHAEQNMPTTPEAPVSMAAGTDFQDFVRQVLARTAENTDPTPVNSTLFTNVILDGDPRPITFYRP